MTCVALVAALVSLGLSTWAAYSVHASEAAAAKLVLRFTGNSEEGYNFRIEPLNPAQMLVQTQVLWAGGKTFNDISRFDPDYQIASHVREYVRQLRPGCLDLIYKTFSYAFGLSTEYVSDGKHRMDYSLYIADARMYGPSEGSRVAIPAIRYVKGYKSEEDLRKQLAVANKEALDWYNGTLKCPEYQTGPDGGGFVRPVEPSADSDTR